jgi:hypothetical protein
MIVGKWEVLVLFTFIATSTCSTVLDLQYAVQCSIEDCNWSALTRFPQGARRFECSSLLQVLVLYSIATTLLYSTLATSTVVQVPQLWRVIRVTGDTVLGFPPWILVLQTTTSNTACNNSWSYKYVQYSKYYSYSNAVQVMYSARVLVLVDSV